MRSSLYEKKMIEAVNVIIINRDKKVLIAKRKPNKPMPNRWEFPGGKLEECGVREINEELELDVSIDEYLGYEDLFYKEEEFRLHFYTAHKIDESQILKLNEHTNLRWIELKDLNEYDLPAKELKIIQNFHTNKNNS